jgi:hypothetical protein
MRRQQPNAVRVIAIAAMAFAYGAADAGEISNVVELFTSQGCSSCPPADRILGQLARDPSVLALSLPVDYWDFGGWKDTLALPENTARQRAYATAGGRSGIYTPQVVVNGLNSAIGSDPEAITDIEDESRNQPGVLAVPLSVAERNGKIEIAVGDAPANAPRKAGIFLLALTHSSTVAIKRGENAGATVAYANVIRKMTKIGDWNGDALSLFADSGQAHANGADAYAVIVQAGAPDAPSAILAAARGP